MSHRRERKNAKKEKNKGTKKDKTIVWVSDACTFYHYDKSVKMND